MLPDGYGKPGKTGQLNKALYGLPEAAWVWHKDLEANLKELGFVPLGSDTGMFLKKTTTSVIAIDTHVDDATGVCSSKEEELHLKESIKKSYKIKEKDTSKPFKVLGILVTRNTCLGMLKMSQSKYIDSVLQRFNMTDSNPVMTPIDKGSHLKKDEDVLYENIKEYQALTGSLTYVAMSTCPDVAYITQFLSQSNKNPTQQDWNAGKRVLKYLKGTKDIGIIYWRNPAQRRVEQDHMTPWGYCDANYAKDSHDWKSTSGYTFMLANSPIAWKSKKQPSVTLSTTEANIMPLG